MPIKTTQHEITLISISMSEYKYKKNMYIFTLFAYFFVRIPKTDKESFLQDKAFGTHVFYLCLRKKNK